MQSLEDDADESSFFFLLDNLEKVDIIQGKTVFKQKNGTNVLNPLLSRETKKTASGSRTSCLK